MESTIEELIELLNDKDDFVVEDAVGQLEIKGEEAVEPLIGALSHRKKNIRLHAATLLGGMNAESAIPALIETLKDNTHMILEQIEPINDRLKSFADDDYQTLMNDFKIQLEYFTNKLKSLFNEVEGTENSVPE